MLNDNKNQVCPSLEEIIAASKPGVLLSNRESIQLRLKECTPDNEALLGVIRFLEDHNYDFDALHQFLDTPLNHSKNKKNTTKFLNIRMVSIAAAIILVIGGTWYFNIKETPAKIIAKAVIYEPGLHVFASIQ